MVSERAEVVRSITAGLLPGAGEKAPLPKRKRAKREAAQEESEESAKARRREPEVEEQLQEEGDRDADGYQRLILFVGQLPFDATKEQVADHFFTHGAGRVKVRLLTDKNTEKSRGMAFIDVESPQQLVRALRLHHSRLMGRAINVERTVGGGGNSEKRKAKLSKLREFQGTRVQRDVKAIVDEYVANSEGKLLAEDFDDRVIEALCSLPRDTCRQVLDEVLVSNIAAAKSRSRWLMGCIKRYLEQAAKGADFLTLEEEKAGIVEKARHAKSAAAASAKPDGPSNKPGGRAGGDKPKSKFARGRIGESI